MDGDGEWVSCLHPDLLGLAEFRSGTREDEEGGTCVARVSLG